MAGRMINEKPWAPEPGKTYDNLNEHIYHRSQGISKSTLAMMSCPRKITATQPPQTPSMLAGSILHKCILEPDKFDDTYAVAPECDRRTKAGKIIYAEFVEDNEDKEVITSELYEKSMAMQKAVHSHPLASELLSQGNAEQSHYWTDERTQELCKSRTDWLRPDNVIVDLKRSASASPWMFSKYIWDYKYHWQDAWYTRGINAKDFYFLVVEEYSDKPMVEIYQLTDAAKLQGLHEVDAALDEFINCRDFDHWPGYNDSDKVTLIDLPKYARQAGE